MLKGCYKAYATGNNVAIDCVEEAITINKYNFRPKFGRTLGPIGATRRDNNRNDSQYQVQQNQLPHLVQLLAGLGPVAGPHGAIKALVGNKKYVQEYCDHSQTDALHGMDIVTDVGKTAKR